MMLTTNDVGLWRFNGLTDYLNKFMQCLSQGGTQVKERQGGAKIIFGFKILTWDFIGVRKFFVELFKKINNNNNNAFFVWGWGGVDKSYIHLFLILCKGFN